MHIARPPTLALACVLAALAPACGKSKTSPQPAAHAHEHRAPHHGALQVVGEEHAHVELVLDLRAGRLTAYVLDSHAERPVRVAHAVLRLRLTGLPAGDATLDLAAVPDALSGETVGDTSRFEGASEALRGAAAFAGTLEALTVRGRTFQAVAVRYPEGNEAAGRTDDRRGE